MKIARVFPRQTNFSPDDDLVFYGPPGFFPPEVDEVHISVSFTWDLQKAERLAKAWKEVAPVTIGGPATNMKGDQFIPGRYLKKGLVITSRGCPNKCWFCYVWKREGNIRELEIKEGWNILDDNLLACSEEHIRKVFAMLKKQKMNRHAEFTGGLEAARLKPWMVDLLVDLKPEQIFFAYDSEDKYEALVNAGNMLQEAGFKFNVLRCYVLIGYPKDTMEQAEKRLRKTVATGFLPMAMLWRGEKETKDTQWAKFQRIWARPAGIKAITSNKNKLILNPFL